MFFRGWTPSGHQAKVGLDSDVVAMLCQRCQNVGVWVWLVCFAVQPEFS